MNAGGLSLRYLDGRIGGADVLFIIIYIRIMRQLLYLCLIYAPTDK